MKGELVIDVETKRSFEEVGGFHYVADLGVSVTVAYSYDTDSFLVFEEKDMPKLMEIMKKATRLIGFNIRRFDLPVLQPYASFPLKGQNFLDLMDDVKRHLGFFVSLDSLAQATLKRSKSGHGLDALRWYKHGEIEKIKKYCADDVAITRDLYEFGKKEGKVFATDKRSGELLKIPTTWQTLL